MKKPEKLATITIEANHDPAHHPYTAVVRLSKGVGLNSREFDYETSGRTVSSVLNKARLFCTRELQ